MKTKILASFTTWWRLGYVLWSKWKHLFLGLSSHQASASPRREPSVPSQKVGLRISQSRRARKKRRYPPPPGLLPRQLVSRPIPDLRLSVSRRHPASRRMRRRPGRARRRPQHGPSRRGGRFGQARQIGARADLARVRRPSGLGQSRREIVFGCASVAADSRVGQRFPVHHLAVPGRPCTTKERDTLQKQVTRGTLRFCRLALISKKVFQNCNNSKDYCNINIQLLDSVKIHSSLLLLRRWKVKQKNIIKWYLIVSDPWHQAAWHFYFLLALKNLPERNGQFLQFFS